MIDYWKIQRSGDLENAVAVAHRIGMDLSGKGLHQIRIELLQDALACETLPGNQIALLFQIAKSQRMNEQLGNALDSLNQSLAITREIGDKAGLCATLFNIGHIHLQKDEFPQAAQAWVTVFRLAKTMRLAQALDALESLANKLELPGGLDGWETLSEKMKEKGQ